MLSQDQINQIIAENESLQMQVKELNEILAEREEELEIWKKNAAQAAELRSMLDVQLDEFQTMQDQIGQKQQQVEGAVERELELEQELTEAAKLQQLYNDLLQECGYTQAQLNDIQGQLLELNRQNRSLQEIAGKMGELESRLTNTVMERDALKTRLALLENERENRELHDKN